MAVVAFDSGLLALLDGSVAFATDPMYAILLTSGYAFDAAHDQYSDVSSSEATDPDYDPEALSGKSVVLDGSSVRFDCDDIDFGSSVSISARSVAILVGSAASPVATDRLIWWSDFGSTRVSTASQFVVRTTDGLYTVVPT